MPDIFSLHRPVFGKVYTSLDINVEQHDADFTFGPHKFLDYIQNIDNTTPNKIQATVPTARDIFYREHRGNYVLRSPEYEFYSEGRILFRNISSEGTSEVELRKPTGFDTEVVFRNFEHVMLPKTAYYVHVQAPNHMEVEDKSKALLEFFLIAKLSLA